MLTGIIFDGIVVGMTIKNQSPKTVQTFKENR